MLDTLAGIRTVTIYLGNICNFNCTYCDRDYIKNVIGGQRMTADDIPSIVNFLHVSGLATAPPDMFTFHGGEPFSYVKVMDKIMDAITENVPGDYAFYIQTNGSQILQHRWFFEKWGRRLEVSISYDFMYQDLNRSLFEIHPTIQMLNDTGVRGKQFQYVMPITDPKVFSLAVLKSITDICLKHNVRRLVLIPLRHIRGKDKFKVVIDELNLPQFFDGFLKFIQMLYLMGIDVVVDGHGHGFDKHYFDDHKQLVLSPDGYLYPEFDFLEYKRLETTVGHWRNPVSITRIKPKGHEDSMLIDKCTKCPSRDLCGLKYLHGVFGTEPETDKCIQFYQMMMVAIQHAQKLKQQPSFFHWIGV